MIHSLLWLHSHPTHLELDDLHEYYTSSNALVRSVLDSWRRMSSMELAGPARHKTDALRYVIKGSVQTVHHLV